jgi:hypothetical protein
MVVHDRSGVQDRAPACVERIGPDTALPGIEDRHIGDLGSRVAANGGRIEGEVELEIVTQRNRPTILGNLSPAELGSGRVQQYFGIPRSNARLA